MTSVQVCGYLNDWDWPFPPLGIIKYLSFISQQLSSNNIAQAPVIVACIAYQDEYQSMGSKHEWEKFLQTYICFCCFPKRFTFLESAERLRGVEEGQHQQRCAPHGRAVTGLVECVEECSIKWVLYRSDYLEPFPLKYDVLFTALWFNSHKKKLDMSLLPIMHLNF